jgi:hypothetical protein
VALIAGLGAIAVGIARYRLPYENDRYFDPETAVVYYQQTAEVYLIAGIVLTIVGLIVTFVTFRPRSSRL